MSNPTDASHAGPCQAFAKRNDTMKSMKNMKKEFSEKTQRMLEELCILNLHNLHVLHCIKRYMNKTPIRLP